MVQLASMRQLRMGQPNLPVSLPRIFTLQVGAKGGNTIIGTSVVGPKPAAAAPAAAAPAAAAAAGVEVLECWFNRVKEAVALQGPATLWLTSSNRTTAATASKPTFASHDLLLLPLLPPCRCLLSCCPILPCKEPSAGLSALTCACKMGREAAMVVAHNQGQLAFVLVSHAERPAASCNQAGSRDHMHVHRAVRLRGDQGLQVTSGNKHRQTTHVYSKDYVWYSTTVS